MESSSLINRNLFDLFTKTIMTKINLKFNNKISKIFRENKVKIQEKNKFEKHPILR